MHKNDIRHAPTKCWACGYVMDCSADPSGQHKPGPGDITMCLSCTSVNVYDKDMKLHKPSDQLQKELENNPSVQATLKKYRETLAEVKSKMVQ